MNPISDDALVRIREGIRLLALRRLGDVALAEDVAQEAIARGLVAIREGRPADPERLGAYFRGIALHVITDLYRDRGNAGPVSRAGTSPPDPRSSSPLDDTIRQERAGRVRGALHRLSAGDRELLRLCYYEGLTSAEIARRKGEPAPRVRKRKQRALERLARQLDERPGHTPPVPATEDRKGSTRTTTPEEQR